MSFEQKNISNFEKSCEFFGKDFSQKDLYEFLKNGSETEKQLACLRIEKVNNDEEAEILMANLTGVDGKIREVVSFKLKEFLNSGDTALSFNKLKFWNIFLDAIIDINGNICRNIISAISNLKYDKNFSEYFKNAILERAFKVIENIEKFSYKDKKYVTNKELFKLYWYLETLTIFEFQDDENFYKLIEKCCLIEEYTIREKTALLINKLPKERKNLFIINKDNNPYVAKALNIKEKVAK